MKKRFISACVVLLILISLVYDCTNYSSSVQLDSNINVEIYNNQDTMTDDYWISATYFANLCPLNFWDSELNSIGTDFQRIKNDGFNSVIIVVPWREFQPDIEKKEEFI